MARDEVGLPLPDTDEYQRIAEFFTCINVCNTVEPEAVPDRPQGAKPGAASAVALHRFAPHRPHSIQTFSTTPPPLTRRLS